MVKNCILRNSENIENGLKKFELKNDIIVYRNDRYPEDLEGSSEKFTSTSIVPNTTLEKKQMLLLLFPKLLFGRILNYWQMICIKKQREF